MGRRRKPKPGAEFFTLVFVRVEEGRYHVVKKKTLDEPKTTVRLGKDKSYIIQYDAPALVHGLNRTYILDWQTGDQYTIGDGAPTNPLTPEELDVILGTKIVREITSAVKKDPWAMILPLLMGALMGFLAAWIIASSLYQAKIDELTQHILEQSFPVPNLGLALPRGWWFRWVTMPPWIQ